MSVIKKTQLCCSDNKTRKTVKRCRKFRVKNIQLGTSRQFEQNILILILVVKTANEALLTAFLQVLVLSRCSCCIFSPTWTVLIYLPGQRKTVPASKTHKADRQMCKQTAQKHFSHPASQQRRRDNSFGRALRPPGQLWQATCGPALLLV